MNIAKGWGQSRRTDVSYANQHCKYHGRNPMHMRRTQARPCEAKQADRFEWSSCGRRSCQQYGLENHPVGVQLTIEEPVEPRLGLYRVWCTTAARYVPFDEGEEGKVGNEISNRDTRLSCKQRKQISETSLTVRTKVQSALFRIPTARTLAGMTLKR